MINSWYVLSGGKPRSVTEMFKVYKSPALLDKLWSVMIAPLEFSLNKLE